MVALARGLASQSAPATSIAGLRCSPICQDQVRSGLILALVRVWFGARLARKRSDRLRPDAAGVTDPAQCPSWVKIGRLSPA